MEYIPLRAAAKKYGVEEKVLTQLISAGMIETKAVSGGILVAVDKNGSIEQANERLQTKEDIIAAKFADLIGQSITLSQAAEKYDVPRGTIQSWVYRSGYLAPMHPDSYPTYFDEAEIAYLVDIYRKRQKTGSRSPLLDENGLPYKLKLPDLAKYRRKKKTGSLG